MKNTIKQKLAFSWLLLLLAIRFTYAQDVFGGGSSGSAFSQAATPLFGTTKDYLPVSPQAGSLGIYGQIPVGCYTGTAEVGIPLYEIKYKELSVPVVLSYHASGLKPDIFPGPVGLGWSMQCGGVISRVINGEADYGDRIVSGQPQLLIDDSRGEPDWNSPSRLYNILHANGYMDARNDPDEYYFNINGHTGRFYMNPDNTFSVQSTGGGTFRIVLDTGDLTGTFLPLEQTRPPQAGMSGRNYNNEVTLLNTIRSITMVDESGITYTFGGSFRSIEYSRPGFEEPNPMAALFPGAYIQPMSWYLVSVQSPNGYSIRFTYEQQTTITKVSFTDVLHYQIPGQAGMGLNYRFPDGEKSTMINGCYLTQIEFPTGRVEFGNSVASAQLDFPQQSTYDTGVLSGVFNMFHDYDDVCMANTEKIIIPGRDTNVAKVRERFFPHKIDNMRVYNLNGKLTNQFRFRYTNSTSQRLRLTSLEAGMENDTYVYSFSYNSQSMGAYMAHKSDYYGYYNNRMLFSHPDAIADKGNNYYNYMRNNPGHLDEAKAPDAAFMQAEILERITYPTKGYTLFGYEPHQYGSECTIWPFGVRAVSGNPISGGVRIKNVKNYDAGGMLLTEKRYHYVKNYLTGGRTSSGVLAYKPQFTERYQDKYLHAPEQSGAAPLRIIDFYRFSTNPIYPMMNTRGNHVTYSEVTIEEPGNGYVVRKYKNYDNGYADREPFTSLSHTLSDDYAGNRKVELWKLEEGQSLKLERGQILAEDIYDNNKSLKQQTTYGYNASAGRFNEGVRYIRLNTNSLDFMNQYPSKRISAGMYYTYFPYLATKTVTDYLNDTAVQSESYTYTTEGRLPKTMTSTDSRGQSLTTTVTYPFESPAKPIHVTMTDRYMLKYPVKISRKKNQSLIDETTNEYALGLAMDNSFLLLPAAVKKKYGNHPEFTEATARKYDKYGNPVAIEYSSGEKVVVLWSYKGSYPVARIEGLTYQQVEDALGASWINTLSESYPGTTSLPSVRAELMELGDKVQVTEYQYEPLVGVITETDPNGIRTYHEYDGMGRLKISYRYTGHDKEIIRQYQYNYKR